MSNLPLRKRHYAKVEELVEEPGPHLLDPIMQKKALARLFYTNNPGPRPAQPSAVSSAHGAITRILFAIPGYVFKDNSRLWEIYEQLLTRLPRYTAFLIVTHESVAPLLKTRLEGLNIASRTELRTLPDRISFTPWAEDPFIVVSDNGELVLMEPHSFHRRDDALVSTCLGGPNGFRRAQSPLYFEGGNTLVCDDFILMGADYAVESLSHLGEYINPYDEPSKAASIMKMYNDHLDHKRTIFYIGSTLPVPSKDSGLFTYRGMYRKEKFYRQNKKGTVQPLFHIDMFITPAGRGNDGRYRFMVGDPALASKILGEPLLPYAMAEIFDDIANGLRAQGFAVHRNPLPLTYVDDDETLARNWYFASANNALVEITNESKTIWMPSYGFGDWKYLSATDEANKAVWESLEFEVITIDDIHPFAEHSGALHCIKKVLQRS
jgi:hypothetical protein